VCQGSILRRCRLADPLYHATATRRLHPDGIWTWEKVYSPQTMQASRPMPPVGGAPQLSMKDRSLDSCVAAISFASHRSNAINTGNDISS